MLAKTFALVVAMAWVHWVLPRPRLAESTRSTAVWGLPISMAALAAAAAWSRSSLAGAWQPLVSEGMVAAVALASAALFDRLWHVLRSPSAGGRVSEFL
jgi:hypothetical protein